MLTIVPLRCRQSLSAARSQAAPYLQRAELAAWGVRYDAASVLAERLRAIETVSNRPYADGAAELTRTRAELHAAVDRALGATYSRWLAETAPIFNPGSAS